MSMEDELMVDFDLSESFRKKEFKSKHPSGFGITKAFVGDIGLAYKNDQFLMQITDRWCDINQRKAFDIWEPYLEDLYLFAQNTDADKLKDFCERLRSDSIEYRIEIFKRDKNHSDWESDLIEKYFGWFYIRYDIDATDFMWSDDSKALLSANDVIVDLAHDSYGTGMFFKELTSENLKLSFDRMYWILERERAVGQAMKEAKENYFKNHSVLEGFPILF